jgi:hypothetical protein
MGGKPFLQTSKVLAAPIIPENGIGKCNANLSDGHGASHPSGPPQSVLR